MSKIFFDTLHYSKRLQEFGYFKEQDDGHVTLIGELVETKLATKDDLKAVEFCLKEDMKQMETDLRKDMKQMESGIRKDMQAMESGIRKDMQFMEVGIRSDMKQLESRLLIKLGGMMTVLATLIPIISKVMNLT